MRTSSRGGWFGAGILSALVAVSASAATVVFMDLEALTKTSAAIVHGKVASQSAHWSGDHRRIFTDVVLDVSETLKGPAQKQVTVRQPGGEVGDIGQRVDGIATFAPGEEVVVFLERRGPTYVVNGLSQGKFHIERSTDGKAAFAVPNSNGARLIDPMSGKEHEGELTALKLSDLVAKVKTVLASDTGLGRPNTQLGPTTKVPGTP